MSAATDSGYILSTSLTNQSGFTAIFTCAYQNVCNFFDFITVRESLILQFVTSTVKLSYYKGMKKIRRDLELNTL